jgi:hypothetical protein
VEEAPIDLVSGPDPNNIPINGANCVQTLWVQKNILPRGLLAGEVWRVELLASE